MNTAKKTLEELSEDDDARRLASEREAAMVVHGHLMAASREAGREEGRQEGRQEGRTDGVRETLVRLLGKRFGPLPSWVEERVRNAPAEQLDVYLDAVVTSGSLEAVFNGNA